VCRLNTSYMSTIMCRIRHLSQTLSIVRNLERRLLELGPRNKMSLCVRPYKSGLRMKGTACYYVTFTAPVRTQAAIRSCAAEQFLSHVAPLMVAQLARALEGGTTLFTQVWAVLGIVLRLTCGH
jgi:hypothetical protein